MSLDGAYDPDNIFAKIIRGEIPSVKVFEDDEVLAFMDVFPQAKGHALVVSKTSQARNLLEAEPEVVCKLALATQKLASATRKALNPDGIVVTQFNGAPAGQTIYHLHFHVIPRWEGVAVKGHAQGGMADTAELARLAQQISAALD
ncbi:MAG: HIT family protein [Proteobacteria bacterium]|nr:HIT family protein [Pseudomonadota bacterium]